MKRTEDKKLADTTVDIKNGDRRILFGVDFNAGDLGDANEKTFWYAVTEAKSDPDVFAAETAKIVSVKVRKENGALTASVNGELATDRMFLNTYSTDKR